MKRVRPAILAVLVGLIGAHLTAAPVPSDANADQSVKDLYHLLSAWSKDTILVGHQNSTLYGVYWKHGENRSDVQDVTGTGPAIYGWDFLEITPSRTSTHYERQTQTRLQKEIIAAHKRGAINTVSWHMRNPKTGNKYDDLSSPEPIASALPGGDAHDAYLNMLDKAGTFFRGLKDSNGSPIPILFRPFHEMNGDWFWWRTQGEINNSSNVRELWKFTKVYLESKHDVHNLLWVYAPGRFAEVLENANDASTYLDAYPGDAFVDVLALDNYRHFADPEMVEIGIAQLRTVVKLAELRNKLAALSETGAEKVPRPKWFTDCMLNPIEQDPIARNVSYCMFWRNAGQDHFYTPPPRHPASEDFIRFRHDPFTIFENDLVQLRANAPHTNSTWLQNLSGSALSQLWRSRKPPNWHTAVSTAPFYQNFDPETQNPRPIRTTVTTSVHHHRQLKTPAQFDWNARTASIDLTTPSKKPTTNLPALIHGGTNPSDITFRVNYPSDSVFSVDVESVSQSGAAFMIEVDGVHARTQHYPVSTGDVQIGKSPQWVRGDVAIQVPPGPREISLSNPTNGWFRIRKVESYVPAPNVKVYGVMGDTKAGIWLINQTREKDLSEPFPITGVTLQIHDVPSGKWTLSFVGLPEPRVTTKSPKNGTIKVDLPHFTNSIGIELNKTNSTTLD